MASGSAAVPDLTLSSRTAGLSSIAELAGELDITCSSILRDQLLGLLRRGSSQLVIDLSQVTYCDASGLAVLVATGRRARLLGGYLRLAAAPPQVTQVLKVTGLHRHLDVFPTVEAATAHPRGALNSTTDAAAGARVASMIPGPASCHAGRPWASADFGELHKVTASLLSHADAWRDADPRARFTPALQDMARACGGSDDTALETAARSLMSALARHPLAHSPAVAVSATRLRRVLDAGCRPALT